MHLFPYKPETKAVCKHVCVTVRERERYWETPLTVIFLSDDWFTSPLLSPQSLSFLLWEGLHFPGPQSVRREVPRWKCLYAQCIRQGSKTARASHRDCLMWAKQSLWGKRFHRKLHFLVLLEEWDTFRPCITAQKAPLEEVLIKISAVFLLVLLFQNGGSVRMWQCDYDIA